jgi:hypothetical protein
VAIASSDVVAIARGDVVAIARGDVVAIARGDVVAIARGDVVASINKRYSDIAAVLAFNRLRNDNGLHLRSSNGDRVVHGYIQILGPSASSDHAKRQGRSYSIKFLHMYIPILPNQKPNLQPPKCGGFIPQTKSLLP